MNNFKKITEKDYFKIIENGYDLSNYVDDRVALMMIGNKADYDMLIDDAIVDCESSVEQLMSIELTKLNNEWKILGILNIIDVYKQQEINIDNKKYRVDFLISVEYGKKKRVVNFVIECDGHEFHQKTKKQVENDYQRQRDLQEAGYEVIRFSGSEIWKSPYKCCEKIKQIISSKFDYER